MEMTKVLAGVCIAGAVSLFAFGDRGNDMRGHDMSSGNMGGKSAMQMQGGNGCGGKGGHEMKGCGKQGGGHEMGCAKQGGHLLKVVMDSIDTLGLSKDQEAKIQKILDENSPKGTNFADFFKADSFDAKQYIESMKNKRDEKIEQDGQLIAKIYAVLTPEQKAEVKRDIAKFTTASMKGKCDSGTPSRR